MKDRHNHLQSRFATKNILDLIINFLGFPEPKKTRRRKYGVNESTERSQIKGKIFYNQGITLKDVCIIGPYFTLLIQTLNK